MDRKRKRIENERFFGWKNLSVVLFLSFIDPHFVCYPFASPSFSGFQQFSFLAQRHLEDFIRKKGKEQLYIITRLVRVSLQLATIYLKQVLRGAIYSSRLCNCYI